MGDQSFVELGWKHRNGIATTLALVDETLCEFEQWAQGREIKSILYTEKNDLSPEQREAILTQVAKIRKLLLDLKDSLKLEGKPRSLKTSMWAQCSALWVNLAEVTSEHLKRYGEVPTGLAEYLDPRVAELTVLTNEILRVIKEG
jgi:hypothetical protein